MSVRLVLSICIVWYHNNRMADSYKHNIMLPRPPGNAGDPERWVQSLIKQTQRSILQAGLNLVRTALHAVCITVRARV